MLTQSMNSVKKTLFCFTVAYYIKIKFETENIVVIRGADWSTIKLRSTKKIPRPGLLEYQTDLPSSLVRIAGQVVSCNSKDPNSLFYP